jgi:hypothetical protein
LARGPNTVNGRYLSPLKLSIFNHFLCTANEAALTTYNIGRTQTGTSKRKLKKACGRRNSLHRNEADMSA